ncbi:MCP four helix bundle domain-containing protein [Phaeodactylibacter luteus]|uniref:Chemotaxis protein n=1 Tax=Phaeodactylibacter luteus TaxID=1564516 RepID=A0A5C6RFX3_9BACT|nr:MCP four helix bundle domain-containing protein [Phaeodactylibacter luteus]TXB60555.1 chemotaxis protein [Phaeodactylibacter luteus]
MKLIDKVKWITGILLVFIIVLTTNLIDKDNFNRLRYAVETIYEDRIVASDLIFEMSVLVQEKELAVATADAAYFEQGNRKANQGLQGLVGRYEQTRLTNKERDIFNDLKEELTALEAMEAQYLSSGGENRAELLEEINAIDRSLYLLSKVQLDEGRRQLSVSNETMKAIDLFTQGEIIFLVLMAILVQGIILYKPRD